jgi:hypothetical protein
MELLKVLIEKDFYIKTFSEYISNSISDDKILILRHDIDRKSKHILHIAKFEKENGIKATYYFPSKIIKAMLTL